MNISQLSASVSHALSVTVILIVALFATAAHASGADKPTVYNPVTEESVDRARQISAQLSPKFIVVDLRDDTNYTPPKPIKGGLPHAALTESGEPLSGYVLIAYVVTTEGRAAEPHILKTTDARLNRIAIASMNDWRLAPATLKGVPIATTAAQELHFIPEKP